MGYELEVHIDEINIGDIVEHNGQERTVGRKDIGYCPFMGGAIFGDNYMGGHKKVKRVFLGLRGKQEFDRLVGSSKMEHTTRRG